MSKSLKIRTFIVYETRNPLPTPARGVFTFIYTEIEKGTPRAKKTLRVLASPKAN